MSPLLLIDTRGDLFTGDFDKLEFAATFVSRSLSLADDFKQERVV